MSITRWMSAVFLGMAMQAAISSAMFPDGIDADQQLRAALLLGVLSVIFGVLGVALHRQDDGP